MTLYRVEVFEDAPFVLNSIEFQMKAPSP